jgi:hypothetical protein
MDRYRAEIREKIRSGERLTVSEADVAS